MCSIHSLNFSLFLALSCLAAVSAVQTNFTIDDQSPLVSYRAVTLDRNLTGFNPSLLNNGTVTFIAPSPVAAQYISMNFTGIAVYVFVAFPSGHTEPSRNGFSARLDGVPWAGTLFDQIGPMANHLAYRNLTMPDGPHNLELQIMPTWELYFDYMVYTTGPRAPTIDSTPTSASSPSVGSAPTINAPIDSGPTANTPIAIGNAPTPSAPAGGTSIGSALTSSLPIASALATSNSTSTPISNPTNSNTTVSSTPLTNSSKKPFPVAAVAGGVVGGVILLALLAIPFILRRRALAERNRLRKAQSLPIKSTTHIERDDSAPDPFLSSHSGAQPLTEKSALRIGIPLSRSGLHPGGPRDSSAYSSESASASTNRRASTSDPVSPILLRIEENMQGIFQSVQRLEEREGAVGAHPPPAYGPEELGLMPTDGPSRFGW